VDPAWQTTARQQHALRPIFLYHSGMKTTLDLRDDLLATAKAQAARARTTLTRIVEEGLALRLRGPVRTRRRLQELPASSARGGLLPGIDPLNNESLLDAADDE
jgi:hypothetical protein